MPEKKEAYLLSWHAKGQLTNKKKGLLPFMSNNLDSQQKNKKEAINDNFLSVKGINAWEKN